MYELSYFGNQQNCILSFKMQLCTELLYFPSVGIVNESNKEVSLLLITY